MGNPVAFSYSSLVWVKGTADALGSPHFYSPSSQDISSRFVANALLYGSPMIFPVPDLLRTDFLLMVGANPVVSHGSAISGTFMRKDMAGIVERGGRVVVVDPRRTETAKLFEHIAVKPDGDAALLLSMLHVIFDEGLEKLRRARRSMVLRICVATRLTSRPRRSRRSPASPLPRSGHWPERLPARRARVYMGAPARASARRRRSSTCCLTVSPR